MIVALLCGQRCRLPRQVLNPSSHHLSVSWSSLSTHRETTSPITAMEKS